MPAGHEYRLAMFLIREINKISATAKAHGWRTNRWLYNVSRSLFDGLPGEAEEWPATGDSPAWWSKRVEDVTVTTDEPPKGAA